MVFCAALQGAAPVTERVMSILEDWQPAAELMHRVEALLVESDKRMVDDPVPFVRDHYRRVGAEMAIHARRLADAIATEGQSVMARIALMESGRGLLEIRAAESPM